MPALLAHLALPDARLALRVTPRAARNAVREDAGRLVIHVTEAPENGKATAAALRLLARALGLPQSRLELLRGAASRDKLVRIRPG